MLAEDSYQRFGTPLDPLEEDALPSKKPIYVEDQIVTDEYGRRRFHGAFTGGFSAGYWNTVGSQEGWTPQSFISSRSEKAKLEQQRPEDFMDDEDLGEFGIAPQGLQIREGYAASSNTDKEKPRKRKLIPPSSGPIPGVPVLHEILKPQIDKIAVRMLKRMGWRSGQGVGARQTRKEKKLAKSRNQRELYVLERYGCQTEHQKQPIGYEENDEDEETSSDDDEITFAPDDYEPYPCIIKNNRFGIGYTGLSREPVLSDKGRGSSGAQHVNLFAPSLEMCDKNNKKLSIVGQAFGVGALEEEDEDIYARDDLSKYDFSLEDKKKKQEKKEKHVQNKHIVENFLEAKEKYQFNPIYIIEVPVGFKPRNWGERKTRFAPLDPQKAKELEEERKKSTLSRHVLKPEQRGHILGEQNKEETPGTSNLFVQKEKGKEDRAQLQKNRDDRTKELLERISSKSNTFTRGGIITTEGEEQAIGAVEQITDPEVQKEHADLLKKAQNKTSSLGESKIGTFKPFLGNEAKQHRYEAFLEADLHSDGEIIKFLQNIQPVELSEWDREIERKEFIQARSIYKPLVGIMSNRFVSETSIEAEKTEKTTISEPEPNNIIIVVERTKTMWKPSALLCKRYNIAEPFGGTLAETKPEARPKLSIFDYLETSVNTKANFQTPVIIPKHIEKPLPIFREQQNNLNELTKSENPAAAVTTVTASAVQAQDTREQQRVSSKEIQPKGFVPKTELEKRVVETVKQHPAEKVELFRAIFEDDSDEEAEMPDTSVAKDPTIPNENDPKQASDIFQVSSAAAANLLRNTSPPRGIFAALFSTTEQKDEKDAVAVGEQKIINEQTPEGTVKVVFKSKNEREPPANDAESTNNVYGPALPANFKPGNRSAPVMSKVDEKILNLLQKQNSASSSEEVWVEKSLVMHEESSDESADSSRESSRHRKKTKKIKKKKNEKRDKKSRKKDKKKKHKSKKSKTK